MELEFLELEFYVKLKFHKFKFQKSDKLLNILKCKIFWPNISHFGVQNFVLKFRLFPKKKKRKEKEKRALATGIDVVCQYMQ